MDQKGYSVYYYDPTVPSKYCVINYESYYDTQRLLLNIGSALVILFTVLGFPFLFLELYQPVIKKLKDDSGSEYWRFIAWSVVIVSFFVNIAIFINNGFVLHVFYGKYGSTSLGVLTFLIVFSVICYGIWIINFISSLAAIWYLDSSNNFSKDLPLPQLLEKLCEPKNSSPQANAGQGNPLAIEQGNHQANAGQGNPQAIEQGNHQANAGQGNPQAIEQGNHQANAGQGNPQAIEQGNHQANAGQGNAQAIEQGNQANAGQGNPQAIEQGNHQANAGQGNCLANAEQGIGNPERSAGTCCCCGYHKGCCRYCIAIALGYTIVVHFLQLLSFHVVYIILGAIALPFETLSVLCNYVTAYLFAVIYIAVILKYMNKVYFQNYISLNFLCCILPLLIGGLSLITGVACFTALFYRFTEVMEFTSQNEGVLGVVKSFLPSLFVTLLGFIGHKILKRIRRNRSGNSNGSSKKPRSCRTQKDSNDSSRSTSSSSTSQTSSSSQEVSTDANSPRSPSRAATPPLIIIEDPTDSGPNRNSSNDSSTKAAAKTTSRAGGKKYSEETEPLITPA